MGMDSLPSGRAAMRQLHGPRPPPLKVRKESHNICKKPPAAQPPYPHRPPIIIYARSPKVVHTTPGEFMSVVQRLTGAAASSSSRLRDVFEKKINEQVAAKDVDDCARECVGPGILSPGARPITSPVVTSTLEQLLAEDPDHGSLEYI